MPTATTAPSAGTAAHAHDDAPYDHDRNRRCGAAGVLDTHRSYVVDPIDLLHARQHTVPQAILDEYPPPRWLMRQELLDAINRLPSSVRRWFDLYAAEDVLHIWERWAYVPHGNGFRARIGFRVHAPAVRRCIETTRAYVSGASPNRSWSHSLHAANAAIDFGFGYVASRAASVAYLASKYNGCGDAITRVATIINDVDRLMWFQQWWVRCLARLAFVLPQWQEDVR